MDTFNDASRDEDKILDQIYVMQLCSEFYYDDFKFSELYTKMYTKIGVALKPNFMGSYSVLYFFIYAFLEFAIFIICRRPKIFALHIFGLKCWPSLYPMIKLSKTS